MVFNFFDFHLKFGFQFDVGLPHHLHLLVRDVLVLLVLVVGVYKNGAKSVRIKRPDKKDRQIIRMKSAGQTNMINLPRWTN